MSVELCDLIRGSGGQKSPSAPQLFYAKREEDRYAELAFMLFERYGRTHAAVSPLTAGFDEFCAALPDEAVYSQAGGDAICFAFIEESEIAYVCGTEDAPFPAFCRALVSSLFERYERIEFESDDCDEYAMALRTLFDVQSEESFNTYVYGK